MEEHRLDTFESLVVALAGVTEPSERTDIRKQLKSGSATTPTTFSLDGSFTHLVCGDIKDSKTMDVVTRFRRKAERFVRRGESVPEDGEPHAIEMKAAMSLRTVWKEWVEDCLAVNGSIDEAYYAVEEPRMTESQRRELKESIMHEREHKKETIRERMEAERRVDGQGEGKRARTEVKETPGLTSHDIQRVTKKPKVDISQFVQQMTIPSATADAEPSTVSSYPTSGPLEARSLGGDGMRTAGDAASPAADLPDGEEREETEEDERQGDVGQEGDDDDDGMVLEDDPAAGLQWDMREKSLSSLSFRLDLRNDERNQAAHRALQATGVKEILAADDARPAHFHILPLGKVDVFPGNQSNHLGIAVTHLFVERCLFESRVLHLNESFALQPAVAAFPIEGAEHVRVALTGFTAEEDVDRKQAEIALRSAGIEASSTLKRGFHTHLLLGKEANKSSNSQSKIQKAKEWGIPCVGLDFVNNIYRSGKIEPEVGKLDRSMRPVGQGINRGSSVAAVIGETQRAERHCSKPSDTADDDHVESQPLAINQQASNTLRVSRPWQRSASGSQALLDGEEARGLSFQHARSHLADSLEAGSLAIKTSAEQVMALLSNRSEVSHPSGSSTSRKSRRQPPSRWKERRAGSAVCLRMPSEGITAEELLDMRQEEEKDRQAGMVGQTQAYPASTQEDASMRVTYEDPSSRRERRKIGELIATSVKHLKAQQEDGESTRSSSTDVGEDAALLPTSSLSPVKRRSAPISPFSPSIQARRQPGTRNNRRE